MKRTAKGFVDHGAFLTLTDTGDKLVVRATTAGRRRAREIIREKRLGTDQALGELLEDLMGNGWDWVRPEDIGALTEAPMISLDGFIADDGKWVAHPGAEKPVVYAHMNYMVDDPIEMFAEGKPVVFVRETLEWTPQARLYAQQQHAASQGEPSVPGEMRRAKDLSRADLERIVDQMQWALFLDHREETPFWNPDKDLGLDGQQMPRALVLMEHLLRGYKMKPAPGEPL